MADAVNEVLADAVLGMIAWLELVDAETLDPDVAVQTLGQLAYHLHRLEGADREWFAAYARMVASKERDPRYRRTFEAVAGDLATDERR